MTTLLHNYQWSSHSFKLFNLLIQLNIPQDMFISAKWPFTFWRPRISGVYDRQDVDLDLGDSVTLPALITVFLAAFLASLVGSSLVGNMTRMLSLEFKVPEPLKIRAIPLGNEYIGDNRTFWVDWSDENHCYNGATNDLQLLTVIGMKSALVCFIAVNNKVTESSLIIINPAWLPLQSEEFPWET